MNPGKELILAWSLSTVSTELMRKMFEEFLDGHKILIMQLVL